MTPLWHTTPCILSYTHWITHIDFTMRTSDHINAPAATAAIGGNRPAPAQPAEYAHRSHPRHCLAWARGPLAYTEQVFTIKQELLARTKAILTQTELHQRSHSPGPHCSSGFETLQCFPQKHYIKFNPFDSFLGKINSMC